MPESDHRRVVLNVGGGSKSIALPGHYRGWEHLLLDIDPAGGADLVCDARKLREGFPAGVYDAVYCSHNLEHYFDHDVPEVLGGFLHVLNDSGYAEIRVPDLGELIVFLAENGVNLTQPLYQSPAGPISAIDVLYGSRDHIATSGRDYYAHKTGFTQRSLLQALAAAGFGELYVAQPLGIFELRVVAFRKRALPEQRLALGLGEPAARDAVSTPATPRLPQAGSVDELYERATRAWSARQWRLAEELAANAIALEPTLPALHYLLGSCLLELGRNDEAEQAYDRCLALKPAHPLAAQAKVYRALCSARGAVASGAMPPVERHAPPAGVSVIVCSSDAGRHGALAARYERLFGDVPHETVIVPDASSLAEGYNRGLRKARHDIVLFAAEDLEIVSPDFAARLGRALAGHDLVGVAGSRRLAGASWQLADHLDLRGQIAMPGEHGDYEVCIYGVQARESDGLEALDGMLVAGRRDIVERIGFDERTFDGWHCCDVDFSLRAALAGYDCATCNDILVLRGPAIDYGRAWSEYSKRFLNKHGGRVQPAPAGRTVPDAVTLAVADAAEWRLLTEFLVVDPPAGA